MNTTTVYRLFGIPLWSVARVTTVTDEEAVYKRMSERFAAEMGEALTNARGAR
jgi:hypothetical protein